MFLFSETIMALRLLSKNRGHRIVEDDNPSVKQIGDSFYPYQKKETQENLILGSTFNDLKHNTFTRLGNYKPKILSTYQVVATATKPIERENKSNVMIIGDKNTPLILDSKHVQSQPVRKPTIYDKLFESERDKYITENPMYGKHIEPLESIPESQHTRADDIGVSVTDNSLISHDTRLQTTDAPFIPIPDYDQSDNEDFVIERNGSKIKNIIHKYEEGNLSKYLPDEEDGFEFDTSSQRRNKISNIEMKLRKEGRPFKTKTKTRTSGRNKRNSAKQSTLRNFTYAHTKSSGNTNVSAIDNPKRTDLRNAMTSYEHFLKTLNPEGSTRSSDSGNETGEDANRDSTTKAMRKTEPIWKTLTLRFKKKLSVRSSDLGSTGVYRRSTLER